MIKDVRPAELCLIWGSCSSPPALKPGCCVSGHRPSLCPLSPSGILCFLQVFYMYCDSMFNAISASRILPRTGKIGSWSMPALLLLQARNSSFASRIDPSEWKAILCWNFWCLWPECQLSASAHKEPSSICTVLTALASILCFGFSPHFCFWLKWTFPLFLSLWVILGEMLCLYHLQSTNTLPFFFFLPTFQEISQLLPVLFSPKVSMDVVRIVFSRSFSSFSDCSFWSFSLCVCAYVCVCMT